MSLLSLGGHVGYYLYMGNADMRRTFEGLCGLVRNEMNQNPLDHQVYIFINKRRTQVKLLLWEGDGFSIFHKRFCVEFQIFFTLLFYSRQLIVSLFRAVRFRNGCSNYFVSPPIFFVQSVLHNLCQKVSRFYRSRKSVPVIFVALLLPLSFLCHAWKPDVQTNLCAAR